MKFSCPNCDSEKITMEKRPGGWFKCQDCQHSWQPYPIRFGFDVLPNKQTVFDRITVSPEVLSPRFIYYVTSFLDGKPKKIWYSTLVENQYFNTELEAKRATVKKLKEVEK